MKPCCMVYPTRALSSPCFLFFRPLIAASSGVRASIWRGYDLLFFANLVIHSTDKLLFRWKQSVIERDKVEKGGVVERDGRSASGKNIGTVVENGVGMRVLVAWYCWPVVAFEGREVDPALTRARKVISLSQ